MSIPFSDVGKLMAFSRPYPTQKSHLERVQAFFPCSPQAALIAFEKLALDLKFMDPSVRVFQSALAPGNKDYLAWLDKMQSQRQKQ